MKVISVTPLDQEKLKQKKITISECENEGTWILLPTAGGHVKYF